MEVAKLLVKQKSSPKKFDKFVDKLYASDVAELKIVENFREEINHDDIDIDSEDTIALLNRYVEESESNINKSQIQTIIHDIYREACELV